VLGGAPGSADEVKQDGADVEVMPLTLADPVEFLTTMRLGPDETAHRLLTGLILAAPWPGFPGHGRTAVIPWRSSPRPGLQVSR
jgi:hypothetical protein